MLENKKNVRKVKIKNIIIKLMIMIIIMVLGMGTQMPALAAEIKSIDLDTGGAINPIYKPEWEKVSSTINIDETNLSASTISIVLKGTASKSQTINDDVKINYSSDVVSGLTADDITVYINGTEASWITKTLPAASPSTGTTVTQTLTLSGFEKTERELGVPYKDWSGNIKIKIGGRGKDPGTYSADTLVDYNYGNQSMMETDQNGTNADGTWIDITYQDTETDHNTNGTMFADFIKPEFTYESSNTTIVGGDTEKVTIIFDVTDKYFQSTTLSSGDASQITVQVDDYDVTELNNYLDSNNHKQLKKTQHIYYDATQGINYVNLDESGAETSTGVGTKVGERYQLVITGLDQGDAFKYSGYMTLGFEAGAITDKSGNTSDATSITIGKDDKDGNPGPDNTTGNGTIVDVVDPIWKVDNIDVNENTTDLKNSTVTLELTATDKYYLNNVFEQARAYNTLADELRNNILIYVDGELDGDTDGDGILETGETPTITKTLSTATNLTPTGTGVKYTLTLSNWDGEKYSGTVKIVIPAGTITDQNTNTSNEQEFIIGHIDFSKPVITKISSARIDTDSDGVDDAVEVVFKATDKFMVMSDLITIPDTTNPSAADEITVYVDDEPVTGITRTLTSEEITETVNGVTVKGHKYTLVISDFEQARTTINRAREFSDWSGTVRIDIKEGAVKDEEVTLANGEVAGGNINDLTKIIGEFADYIKPNITYEYSSTDIVRNHEDKTQRTFTMVFDITDKYFSSSAFATALEEATTDAAKLNVLKDYLTIWIDNVNITDVDTVTKKIVAIENVIATINKTTNIDNKTIENVANAVIGKRFTLEISGLEQDVSTAVGNDYLDYSGVVTVAIEDGAVIDQGQDGKANGDVTKANTNVAGSITAPSITSGVNTPDGTGTGVIVDLVDPIWEQAGNAEARPYEKYASITIKGTDKYIQTNNLQASDITITVTRPSGTTEVNGANAVDQGMTLTITEDTSVTLAYGKQYKVELNGYASDSYQVKLTLKDGILVDQSGNTSQETEFILFTSLVETSSETTPESEFLSLNKESGQVIPQRKYVEQVIFQSNLDNINETKWDVSQLNDGTIWAWYTTRTADDGTTLYTVYIGSYIIMNGNVNSSYLFANLGSDTNCKVTGDTTGNEMLKNLYVLQVSSVTNMFHMFDGCGYANMKSLDLGTAFNTVSATNMANMFQNCGYTAMTTLNLGINFNTSNVTNMSEMFKRCGYTALMVLDLSSGTAATNTIQFNTSKVTSMSNMFNSIGHEVLTSLNLGNNFDTSNVTKMGWMFCGTGYKKMQTLDLGDKFNTSKVTQMEGMFWSCGREEMTGLDLGELFDTRNVSDMEGLFAYTGYKKMTSLDLGNKFYTTSATNMIQMFDNCGSFEMTTLDLGPAFTKIPSGNATDRDGNEKSATYRFVTGAGKDGECIIYAPESIYNDMTHFKLNTSSTETIEYTRGTINPVYRPEWTKVSSSLNKTTGVMTVVINGAANKVGTPVSQINYTSDVTSLVTPSDIKIYIDGELAEDIDASDITISSATTVTNETTNKTEVQYTITISNFEQLVRQSTKNYKEWSGNVALQLAKGTLKDKYGSSVDADGNVTIDLEGNSNLAVIDIDTSGTTENIVVEAASKLSANTTTTEANMFIDLIKPEFTYKYSGTSRDENPSENPEINYGTKTVTVVFDVTDKYFDSTELATNENIADLITVKMSDYTDEEVNSNIEKTIEYVEDVYYPDNTTKVGERYKLVISKLEQTDAEGYSDGFDFSGYMSIAFPSDIVTDKSGNKNSATTIAIGLDENDGNPNTDEDVEGDGVIVDVVDPVWEMVESSVDSGAIKIRAVDKYFDASKSSIDEDDITVYVNGAVDGDTNGDGVIGEGETSAITKEITGYKYIKLDENGDYVETTNTAEAIGIEYTLELGNVTVDGAGYVEFTPTNASDLVLDENGKAKYRLENGGAIKIKVAEGKITDKSGNQNRARTFDIGNMDSTKPEVYEIQKTQDSTGKTETIIFNVTDRNYDPTDFIETGEITLWIDGVQTDSITISSLTSKEIKTVIDNTEKVVGHQYTLVLTDIVETQNEFVATGRKYRELSGTLEVKIAANAAKDQNLNTLNTATTTINDFVDFIRPEINYKYAVSSQEQNPQGDINYENKTFTMVFEILDKYIKESTLKTELENATTEAEKQEVIEDFLEILIDGETPDWSEIDKDLTVEEVEATTAFNKTVDGAIVNDTHVIGYKYTLVLSNLEQLQIKSGDKYLEYSGVITAAIEAGIAIDTTGNSSVAKTITSGIDIIGDVQQSGDSQIVDVVKTLWQKVSVSTDIHTKTATIVVKGTDKYLDITNSTLTSDKIKLFVNGTETTGTINVAETTVTKDTHPECFEDRMVDGTTTSVQIGQLYTITVTEFPINANQVKIQLTEGTLIDKSGNKNDAIEFMVYNTLRIAGTADAEGTMVYETEATSGFLGNTTIQRQNIENITFLSSAANAPEINGTTCWDVSAQGDESIIAWYETSNANGALKIYIASALDENGNILGDIYGNIDSSHLFHYIGDADICTATETISNIGLLNVSNVTNMQDMFNHLGTTAMTSLNLGNNFDTSNVTDMGSMFGECGYYAMTTLNLGSKFDTSKVTDMTWMFSNTGYKAMTALNLGTKFNTSNVQNMYAMFYSTGYTAMTTLTLGDKFDTSNVTNMEQMFRYCGYTAMTSLDLSSGTDATNTTQFNTSNVKSMKNMFRYCGYTAMTSFNIGTNFDTSKVTDMQLMFGDFGNRSMQSLNLGTKFNTSSVTNMYGMFWQCGYKSMTSLNLGELFDTSSVTNMKRMFCGCGYTAMTSLDLGDKFYTTNVTNMYEMFSYCGVEAMTSLDFGPAFTKIPNGTVTDDDGVETTAYQGFIYTTGKSGACTIYAPESIYNDMTHFKLSTDSTTTIEYTRGTINPIYKPEWEKVSSSLDETTGIMTIVVNGYAYETFTIGNTNTDPQVYASNVTSTIPVPEEGETVVLTDEQAELINVYIDNELTKLDANGDGTVEETIIKTITASTTSTNATTGATEIQYTITLDLEEAVRQSGKNFKEWSGNVSLQFAKGTLVDVYGNKNLAQIDVDTAGTIERIEIKDTTTNANADGVMFADTIEPEFTYEYYNTEIEGDTNANTVIDYANNKVTIVFDVTDKYFSRTDLASDTNGSLITVIVDEDSSANSAIRKALSKKTLEADEVVGNITYKANGDIYYTVNGTSQKIGERYELVITGLESANGVGYSGPMTLTFPSGIIEDTSGNTNDAKTITIGIDEPDNHPEHDEAVNVDVVNPIWVGLRDVNSIDRTNDTVSIKILGIDKFYKTNTLSTDKITVYVDLDGNGTIEDTEVVNLNPNTDMVLEAIDATELATLAEDTELANYDDVKVGYTLKLSGFGDISGMTKIKIADGTIEDQSGNLNINTDPIFAGNIVWVESNEPLESTETGYPRYTAFRNDIVDFIDPVINYTYSTVEVDTDGDGIADSTVSANPDIDYDRKQVTVKFTVTDKYLLESDLIKTDASGNQIPKNIRIIIDGTEVYNGNSETQSTEVTTSISETAITGGKEYTLVVSNLQQTAEAPENTTPANGDGFKFSGPMQLVFESGAIEDTSGNTNAEKTISLETHVDPDVVDVVDPIIKYVTSSINRTGNTATDTVTLQIKAEDKYLSTETLSGAENSVQVKVLDEDGNEITGHAIIKDITLDASASTSQSYIYNIVLSNFGVYEGKTSVIIPADVVKDTSGNGNVETEILVGNSSDTTAFKDSIVDFTKPTWEYVTSSIDRNVDANGVRTETGTVTIEVKGTDIYFDDEYFNDEELELDLSDVKVYINGVENTQVTKAFATNDDGTIKKEYFEETKELATGYSRVLKGVKYTIVLGNFGTNEQTVKIEIPKDAIKDTSTNGNIETQIDVGNPEWIETVGLGSETEDADNPKYTAFRNDIVDFIKPVIKYQYVANTNPLINRTDETVDIIFTATDTNFLESNLGVEDFKIYIDNMQVYGDGASVATDIQAQLLTPEDTANGLKYTLRLSSLELNGYIEDVNGNGQLDEGEDINGNGQLDTLSEMFERHSGVIKLVIAADQVADTSGNKNIETTIIVDNGDGDDQANGIIVDFVNPNIYYQDKYLNWEDEYALITLRATDRFYDTDTELKVSDIKLYEERENDDGTIEYIDITETFSGKITINKSNPLVVDGNIVGYDYTIRLDDFVEEFKLKIVVAAGAKDEDGNILNGIGDTSGNLNDGTDIFVDLDNRRPTWNYVSTDTSEFESDGKISFTVKGKDKFLDITNSNLVDPNIKVLKDGVDITSTVSVTVNYLGADEDEKSKSYKIDVTGLTEMGTYSLVFAKDTLVDEFKNKSAATTISFSNSVIASNTDNYINVTYHITPDMETVHKSFVHELMSVNTTGTNFENTTYRPSTIGEIFNNGENPLFAEPMYVPSIDGYTISKVYKPKSFAGWAEADEDGNAIEGGTVYGLYDEIPNTVTHLKAVWQDATIVFVSTDIGDNSYDGKLPTTPVKDLETAYTKLNASGTAENNIIIIMDEVEYDSTSTLSGNATITSVYAGVDYRNQGAELKVSSNMVVDGDITFDNIKLYVDDTDNKLISNYSGDITLGRGIITPSTNYTFGAIIGGDFDTQSSTGELGTHTIRVEAGKYNNIIAGSSLTDGESTTVTKSITHNVVIGNMRDAAVSRNDKLTITGYVAIGENEEQCFPTGVTNTTNAVAATYANVTLYSGTITSTDTAIYLRSINGETDGLMNFEMFGGVVTGNVYGGSRISTSSEATVFNIMNFYGGQVTGNIFGQGLNDTFTGSSTITLQGNFNMTGNVFGGSNRTATTTTAVGKGNSIITINSSSVTVSGNIYGGGNVTEASTGYITGTTNITLNSGTVTNIYGSGYNCGNTGETNITIENGIVNGNIFGGAYQNQARKTSNITVLGGTVHGNIYGGNENIESQLDGDAFFQDVNIIIGDTDTTKAPTINGIIYGGGKYDKVDVATIELIECTNTTSVYGGAEGNGMTITANIYLKGMTVNEIYGGSKTSGTETPTVSAANIYLQSGTVTDVYGGGFESSSTESNISLEGTATVTSIYGGSSTSGKVTTSNVTLKSGTVTNVFGGGNSAAVGTANVTLDGITIGTIHGGSKDSGVTTTTNVTLKSGTVTNVFGGGLDVGVTTANVTQQGATVTNIYGGNNTVGTESATGGETGTANVEIVNSTVANVYGGNYLKGTTRYANINIHGTSTVTGNVYGGGYKSNIGKSGETGTTTINIASGTINGDINGGSEQGIVYGTTNINVGFDAIGNASLTPGAINIIGTIYGAGSTLTAGEVTVVGNTNITMDNGTTYPITYYTADDKEKSIYGSGNGGGIYSNGTETDKSTIHLKDFGTSDSVYLFKSIEDTGNLYIGNSVIELVGALDEPAASTEVGHYYTLNTITNALTIYNNTTLYTQRGFNKVGGYYSYVNQKSTKATVTITDGVATTNVDNKLYTLEGVNLIFAKKEVTLANKSSLAQSDWGEVTGMTYFGTYKNTSSGKQYDLSLFKAGTYVEGQYNSYHDINADGFYTTATDGAQIIDTVNYTNYCDWIINAPTINYDIDLVASTYGQNSVAELLLDYKYASDYTYAAETIYTLSQVSTNALKAGIELVDPTDKTKLPTISTNANNTFGLTMETTESGWQQQALTNIYTAGNGSFGGDSVYTSDAQTVPGTIKFKIHNSLNITEEKDLGIVTIKLTGQQPISGSGTESYTFNVVIAVNLQTIVDELETEYKPSFTDRAETVLNYSTDSRVDLSYLLYNNLATTPYATDDYRVISTTIPLPKGTKLTMKDYGQGDNVNKVYYYQVASDTDYYATETVNGTTRYLYKLSNFAQMGSTNDSYVDSTTYYHSTEQYVLEKYDISIDFIDANVDTKVSADILAQAQETYLELRNSSGTVKYDNGDTTIKYNLKVGGNAVATADIETESTSYSVSESIEIPIEISASILQQTGILDTKYHDQIAGIAIQIVGENNIRIKSPELQNFKLTNNDTGEVYEADSNGVIRMPIIEGLGSNSGNYTLSITQVDVTPGLYTAQVLLYTADDGLYYGTETEMNPDIDPTLEFNITFISRLAGLLGVKTDNESSRIINKTTGLNLVDGSVTSNAIDMTVGITNPTDETNIRVELYKRNATYTDLTDEKTYTGTSYTLVDIKDYLQGTWTESSEGSKEYIISAKKTYETVVELETMEFERAIVEGISTGEYKLVFKAYSDDTLVQTFSKTFMVTP